MLLPAIYPIFLEVLTNEKISVGPPFYNKLILPFLVPFLIFMTFVPYLRWIKSEYNKIKIDIILLFILSFIVSILLFKQFGFESLMISILIPFFTSEAALKHISWRLFSRF